MNYLFLIWQRIIKYSSFANSTFGYGLLVIGYRYYTFAGHRLVVFLAIGKISIARLAASQLACRRTYNL